MESKFHEDGVITGIADSFCLSCHKYLEPKDIEVHIAQPAHRENFQSTAYAEKYGKEFIRKVKLGYYCEVCNLMMQTLAKTSIHVNDVAHINNKNKKLLKESDNGVIAFDDILIEKDAWHGLAAEGSCFICNMDYSDDSNHINDHTHILNLIQSKFELHQNEYVYRKIDEYSYNCLVCNIIITKDSKTSHISEPDHKNKYMKCQENKRSLSLSEKQTDGHDAINNAECDASNNDSANTEVDSTNVEIETKIACNSNKANEKINDKDDDELIHPAEALKRAMEYAKQNNLIYKRNGTYCKYCDVKISSSLKMLKEHVEELSHKDKVQNKTNKKLQKVPMLTFIDSETSVENFFFHDIVINDEFCLSALSFHMINTHGDRVRCHVCNVAIDSREIEQHKRTFKHVNAMQVTPVLADFKTEFVRELRPKIYHCGYCNFVEASLDSMKKHLMSVNHNEKKIVAKRRLQNVIPDIIEERQQRRIFNVMRGYLSSQYN